MDKNTQYLVKILQLVSLYGPYAVMIMTVMLSYENNSGNPTQDRVTINIRLFIAITSCFRRNLFVLNVFSVRSHDL